MLNAGLSKWLVLMKVPSNQDILIAERLVPLSRAQINFVFGSEMLLEKTSQESSLLTFTLRYQKDRSVSFVDEIG